MAHAPPSEPLPPSGSKPTAREVRLTGRTEPEVPSVAHTTGAPNQRIQLGAVLRALRQARGITAAPAAASLLVSQPKISRMESGKQRISPRDVRDLCKIYEGQDQQVVDALIGMAG
ncbi:helix-turn-helix domain-containing protein [Streptomyces wuyuanensis]|uniref:helix-turn-helix domain-containing protein n=1 Tax=Streptomyces wuyuanensis TaxID=1196353 RepID=UPI00371B29BF